MYQWGWLISALLKTVQWSLPKVLQYPLLAALERTECGATGSLKSEEKRSNTVRQMFFNLMRTD
jgi:hypothetical protein